MSGRATSGQVADWLCAQVPARVEVWQTSGGGPGRRGLLVHREDVTRRAGVRAVANRALTAAQADIDSLGRSQAYEVDALKETPARGPRQASTLLLGEFASRGVEAFAAWLDQPKLKRVAAWRTDGEGGGDLVLGRDVAGDAWSAALEVAEAIRKDARGRSQVYLIYAHVGRGRPAKATVTTRARVAAADLP